MRHLGVLPGAESGESRTRVCVVKAGTLCLVTAAESDCRCGLLVGVEYTGWRNGSVFGLVDVLEVKVG